MNAEHNWELQHRPVTGVVPNKRAFLSRWRLPLTGAGAALVLYSGWQSAQPEMLRWSLPFGIAIAFTGLLMRMWATGWLCKNDVLATQGPYALTRNPLYLGTCLIATGHSLMTGLPFAPVLFPALCVLLYWPTMREEEAFLQSRYGEAFANYRARVPLLLPGVWNLRLLAGLLSGQQVENGDNSFLWKRVRRCYKGFLANALVIVLYALIQSQR